MRKKNAIDAPEPTEDRDLASNFLERSFQMSTAGEAKTIYGEWATQYERHLTHDLGYTAPELVAEVLHERLEQDVGPVLDIGCGTGLAGEALRRRGDWRLHGLDICPEMLEQAERKGIYDRLVTADLTERLPFEDDTYPAAISSGTFTVAHVKAVALDEIARVLTPKAVFAFTVHSDVWDSGGFEEKMSALEADDVMEMVAREQRPHLAGFPDKSSFICTAQMR